MARGRRKRQPTSQDIPGAIASNCAEPEATINQVPLSQPNAKTDSEKRFAPNFSRKRTKFISKEFEADVSSTQPLTRIVPKFAVKTRKCVTSSESDNENELLSAADADCKRYCDNDTGDIQDSEKV